MVLLTVVCAAALWLWLKGAKHTPAHRAITLLGLYAAAGVAMLVASRSTFEWGDYIDTRHALQYSFAIALIAILSVREFVPARGQRVLGILGLVALGWVGWHTLDVVQTERSEVESWQAIAADRATLGKVVALPPERFLASNDAVLLRLETGRAVRQLDVGGDDASFASSLALLADAAAERPAEFVLICSEWTTQFSVCGGQGSTAPTVRCNVLRSAAPVLALCTPESSPRGSPPGGHRRSLPTPVALKVAP